MFIGKIEVKRRVWIGLASALAVTGAWWIWTRAQPPQVVAVAPGAAPFVRLTGAGGGNENQVLRERAEYFDPTPLFFPTERNYGQKELPASVRRLPGQVFGSFEPKFNFQDQSIKPYGAESPALPEQLVDVVTQGNEAPFAGLGQVDVSRPALAERSGFMEIRSMREGNIVASHGLTGISLPQLDFKPVEFIAVVSSTGLVCDPVVVAGSGHDEVDAILRTYLVKTFRLGGRLSPGLYRVLVGP